MSVTKKTIFELTKNLRKEYPNHLLMFKAGAMVQVFDEDAVLINRLLGYKINLLGSHETYLRSGFPLNILEKVIKQIKLDLKLPAAFFCRDKETQEMSLEKEYNLQTRMTKRDYINQGDVDSCISELKANYEQINTINLSKNALRKNDSFVLHSKLLRLFAFISASVSRYMPNIYKASLGQSYINEWVFAIKQVNLLKNIPSFIKNDKRALLEHKSILYSRVSSSLDLLKDLSQTIYRVKGFKNKKSYKFLALQLTEISRINLKLQANFSEQKMTEIFQEANRDYVLDSS
jgi:hypothetical protein